MIMFEVQTVVGAEKEHRAVAQDHFQHLQSICSNALAPKPIGFIYSNRFQPFCCSSGPSFLPSFRCAFNVYLSSLEAKPMASLSLDSSQLINHRICPSVTQTTTGAAFATSPPLGCQVFLQCTADGSATQSGGCWPLPLSF